jgi:hypothetical protein
MLLLSGLAHNKTISTTLESIELNYLSHCVLRLFEDVTLPFDDPFRFYVNVQFSPGAALDPFIFLRPRHILPVSRPVPVNGRIPWVYFKATFSNKDFTVRDWQNLKMFLEMRQQAEQEKLEQERERKEQEDREEEDYQHMNEEDEENEEMEMEMEREYIAMQQQQQQQQQQQ